ncbi:TetR/AcrR family transcriptional regulator [Paenarthrobacter sp. NEAU-H11]|uniref:TetR/AcrR family transcriptional regulator n=1 Tax=Paenarthrobacter sp. NEAU-H11 TaxID=3423924 RepID=UPI003D343102
MVRVKNQLVRRDSLIKGAQSVVTKYGLEGARLNLIAEEAGLTSGAVLYYYPDISDLIMEAGSVAMERFYEQRVRMLSALPDDPVLRINSLIRSGLPSGSDDVEVALLCTLGGSAGRNSVNATLLTSLYERQVSMYVTVLEQGAARGIFTLSSKSVSIARNLVALEDAYGYRIIAKHPTIDTQTANELILDYARMATGHPLTGD